MSRLFRGDDTKDRMAVAIKQLQTQRCTGQTLTDALERLIRCAVVDVLTRIADGQPSQVLEVICGAAEEATMAVVELGPLELETLLEQLLVRRRPSGEPGSAGVVLAADGHFFKVGVIAEVDDLPDIPYTEAHLSVTGAVRAVFEEQAS